MISIMLALYKTFDFSRVRKNGERDTRSLPAKSNGRKVCSCGCTRARVQHSSTLVVNDDKFFKLVVVDIAT